MGKEQNKNCVFFLENDKRHVDISILHCAEIEESDNNSLKVSAFLRISSHPVSGLQQELLQC